MFQNPNFLADAKLPINIPHHDSTEPCNREPEPTPELTNEPSGEEASEEWSKIAPVLKSLVRENLFLRWFADARLLHQEDGTWILTVPTDTH